MRVHSGPNVQMQEKTDLYRDEGVYKTIHTQRTRTRE